MEKRSAKTDPGSWAIGGGLMIGTGVGFFVLQKSALFFIGSISGGLGMGLILAAVLWACRRQ